MLNQILGKVFGTKHERDLKRMAPQIDAINDLEPEIEALTDDQLRAKTGEFKSQIRSGTPLGEILVPAFAVVREASRRTLGMRHFDVQLAGGIVLHEGRIAEMKTGEGKTLAATLPVYLNALTGKGVHVVTVNDYLARRDAEWMAQVYRFLGLTVGIIQHDMPELERQQAYAADITYGTNNEYGFDYLRDNMKFGRSAMVQRPHHYAIVDEVDSILVDEARTPLIISGPSEESIDKYYRIDKIIPRMVRGEETEHDDGSKTTTGDFLVDEKAHTVALTDDGVTSIESLLSIDNLYDLENMDILHGVNQGLRAYNLFKLDVDYLIKDGQVVIVDEFTGRMMPGRRWSDGLHQAVEAKEGVKIERENQTLATITFQNYFRMYEKLAGMTGTAETEATELGEIYDLDVVVIPTNRPMTRDDRGDLIYLTTREKWEAVVEEIADCAERGQPALVGTISIENSEKLSAMLKRRGVSHVVLNAKYHEREASIVAQAGRKSAITIATNMAGRGTDIVLGGNPEGLARAEADPEVEAEDYEKSLAHYQELCAREKDEVLESGGLHILGTERHESRRIDNQLRGRSGRQGDPGSSRFYLSMDDDLMRIFGSDRVKGLMGKLGMEEGEPIEHNMVSKAIERAQRQVEGRNFEMRKHLLEYDDVMNKQREAIYQLRRDILDGREGQEYVQNISHDLVGYVVETHCPERSDPRDWELSEVATDMLAYFDIDLNAAGIIVDELGVDELTETLQQLADDKYNEKTQRLGAELMTAFQRDVMLRVVDQSWKDHLLALDHLKEGINLRAMGQKDPKNEYKRESFELFQAMKERIEDTTIKTIYRVEPMSVEQMQAERQQRQRPPSGFQLSAPPKTGGPPPAQAAQGAPAAPRTIVRSESKVGRNDPCPCGSGKKYKKCHGSPARVGG